MYTLANTLLAQYKKEIAELKTQLADNDTLVNIDSKAFEVNLEVAEYINELRAERVELKDKLAARNCQIADLKHRLAEKSSVKYLKDPKVWGEDFADDQS